MLSPTFEDCTLEINEKHGKGYPMILSGPAGRQTGTLLISPAAVPMRESLTRLKCFATDEAFLRLFGHTLFAALFPPRMLVAWNKNRQKVAPGAHLRLKLVIQPPEVAALPWELMCDEDGIPVTTGTPIVRYLACPDPPKPLLVKPPLRVLVSIASPRDQAPLSSNREQDRIAAALAPLVKRGLVDLRISEQSSGISLLNDLRRGAHVWHFIGHGAFNASSANGSLAFENESRDTDLIDARRLRILLEQSSVRLAILNACESARFSLDPLLGIAPALVRAGVPAVVAMQFAFPDVSAVDFSSMFYEALADGYPVDACVSEGRKAVITKLGLGQPDWAIPVLYMRAPDGRLFVQDGEKVESDSRRTDNASARPSTMPDYRQLDTASLRTMLGLAGTNAGATGGAFAARATQTEGEESAVPGRRLLLAIRREVARRQGCHSPETDLGG